MATPEKTKSLSELIDECSVASEIESVTLDITAETAKAMLGFNTTNRPLSQSVVKLYANEMLRGKWKLNGEPIIVGSDDKGAVSIISGQHRLHALIHACALYEADPSSYPYATTALHTVVITGVPIEAADSVDLGMGRKHAHVLYRDEWIATVIPKEWSKTNSRKAKWCNCLATAARLVWLRAGGATVSSAPKFIVSEMIDFIKDDHKDLCKYVSSILSASEEDGGGLKISLPYIAALCYVASLNEDTTIDKPTMELLLDAMLRIAQNTGINPGTAEHALAAHWNKLSSTPGSKDRDLDIVGPFVKALNAIVAGEKITPAKLVLTKKEAELYSTHPPLLVGWDEHSFINAVELRAQQALDAAADRKAATDEKESARSAKEAARAIKETAAAKAAVDKATAKAEVDAVKANVPVKPGVMSAMANVVRRKPVSAKS